MEVVSRSDSTLRGHVVAEIAAIDAARRRVTGAGFDGVLLVPCFFEAGRFTAGDIHWANVSGQPIPAGDTEFAQDSTFGYTSSNLRDFIAEKSRGTITSDEVHSISLDDIRLGGPTRVAEILDGVTGGAFVVVNATDYADLEIVVLGLLEVQERGKSFGYRCGPSFLRALAGLEPQGPLTAAQIWPTGRPGGHGLVVVGSHVGLTSRQVAKAQERGGLTETELHVPTLLDPDRRDAHVADIGRQVVEALATSDVLLFTSRTLIRGGDADDSLAISRTVSTAVIEVVRAALAAHPAWVVAKGGITSHDVAVRGLGIRRAEVIGQLFPGMVSVFRPIEAAPEAVGTPTWCSPATSATTTPSPTSSTSSPDADDPVRQTRSIHHSAEGNSRYDQRRMDRSGSHGFSHGIFRRQGWTRGHGLRYRPAEGRGPSRRRRQSRGHHQ
mgnify:CR=1 FL=1